MCGPKCFKKVKGFFRRKKVHRLGDIDDDDSDVEEGGRERSVVFVNMVPKVFGSGGEGGGVGSRPAEVV